MFLFDSCYGMLIYSLYKYESFSFVIVHWSLQFFSILNFLHGEISDLLNFWNLQQVALKWARITQMQGNVVHECRFQDSVLIVIRVSKVLSTKPQKV